MKKNSHIKMLAERLIQDIQRRGLGPGDRYVVASEAARILNVSTTTAHRAMKMLADRGVLMRNRGSGTFVGTAFKNTSATGVALLRTIHVMLTMDYHRTVNFPGDIFVEGIGAIMPRTAIQIHYVPEHNPLEYTRQVCGHLDSGSTKEGIILVRSTNQVQKYIEDSRFLAVVFGSVYPSVKSLPWLDVDQGQTGRLMAQYVLKKGYKKFALIMHSEWRSGDNILLNAVTQELGDANVSMDSLTVYSIPSVKELISEDIKTLLLTANEPIAILCRVDFYADVVIEVAKSLGLVAGEDFGIVSGGHLRIASPVEYPCVVPTITLQEQVQKLADMLRSLAQGQKLENSHFLVDVELQDSI